MTNPAPLRPCGRNVMSNFDHRVEEDVAAYLMEHPDEHGGYPGWGFYGRVWFDNGEWACAVSRHGGYVETIRAGSLEELMETVSEKYGRE